LGRRDVVAVTGITHYCASGPTVTKIAIDGK
jgi:hypothetical protein